MSKKDSRSLNITDEYIGYHKKYEKIYGIIIRNIHLDHVRDKPYLKLRRSLHFSVNCLHLLSFQIKIQMFQLGS